MWRGGFVCLFARSPAPTSLTTRVAQLILHDLEMPYDIAFSIDSGWLELVPMQQWMDDGMTFQHLCTNINRFVVNDGTFTVNTLMEFSAFFISKLKQRNTQYL